MTLGVPRVDEARQLLPRVRADRNWRPATSRPATVESNSTSSSHRFGQLVEATLAADDSDDLARIASAAAAHDLDVTNPRRERQHLGRSSRLSASASAPPCAIGITQSPFDTPPMNGPGNTVRDGDRAPAIFVEGPAAPRRLGHVLWGTPDIAASKRFLVDVLGFRLSDESAGIIAFLRCSPDHHNIGLIGSPVPFFHHSSWQVDDVDEIGRRRAPPAHGRPDAHVWGLGRHFLGSNPFWYFRDPAGNFAEYFADLDQIGDDDAWIARDWAPDKSLYAWGPPVPRDFVDHPTSPRSRRL